MYRITSTFGARESFRAKPHSGIDLKMEEGTPLKSIRDGVIEKIADYGEKVNAGKCIQVKWEDGKTAIYGHLSKFGQFQEGQTVHTGDIIGYSGNTGFSTGAHLHFGLKEGGKILDPTPYISDIQHMNELNPIHHIAQHTPEITQTKINFFDFMSQHMNSMNGLLSDLKVQFIHIITLTDYSPFIKFLQHIFQFIFFNS